MIFHSVGYTILPLLTVECLHTNYGSSIKMWTTLLRVDKISLCISLPIMAYVWMCLYCVHLFSNTRFILWNECCTRADVDRMLFLFVTDFEFFSSVVSISNSLLMQCISINRKHVHPPEAHLWNNKNQIRESPMILRYINRFIYQTEVADTANLVNICDMSCSSRGQSCVILVVYSPANRYHYIKPHHQHLSRCLWTPD